MTAVHYVRCYRDGRLVRSELCMTLWEADTIAKELRESGWYDDVKIISIGENDAKLV